LPWHDKVMIGTTDTLVDRVTDEPRAKEEEIEFILENAGEHLTKKPTRSDVESVFAGLRPLVQNGDTEDTATISREHLLMVSSSGLITIAWGKWTTYRKMAEDVIDQASEVAGLEDRECRTKTLKIHGWTGDINSSDSLHYYGSDKPELVELIKENPELGK